MLRHAFRCLGFVAALLLSHAAVADGLEVGAVAPDFRLEATDGRTYTLSEFKGVRPVVIAWYPKAYTQGCTIECKSLAEKGHLIKAFDVAYFMASVDPLDDNKGFAAENGADFPLLSDPTKATAEAYGVLSERGFAKRYTYYIDIDGKVAAVDRAVKPATSAEDMAAQLEKLGVAKR
jgi:peroxiredoxin Q/BCP